MKNHSSNNRSPADTDRHESTVDTRRVTAAARVVAAVALALLCTGTPAAAGELAIGMRSVPRQAESKSTLDIDAQRQRTGVWCWAATVAMVVSYLQNFDVKDCEVLAEYDMRLGGSGFCCLGAPQCVRTGALEEMEAIFEQIFDIGARLARRPLSYERLVESIDDGRPLIAGLELSPGSGHVVVVAGYEEPRSVVVLDPMSGRQVVPYDTLVANWTTGHWTSTFEFRQQRASEPGCSRAAEQVVAPVPCMTPMGWSVCPGPTVSRQRVRCG